MASVYSTRFIAGIASAGLAAQPRAALDYTVPEGFRAVVRSVCITTGGSGNVTASLTIAGLTYLLRAPAIPAESEVRAEMNQVLNAGEVLEAICDTGSAWFAVSGFLLSELPIP